MRARAAAFVVALATVGAATVTPAVAGAATARDWELTGAGEAQASFAQTTIVARHRRAKVLQDLTVQAPISCADSPTPAIPVDVEVIAASVRLSANGSFSSGSIRHGSGTVVHGRLQGDTATLSYRHVARTPNLYDGSTEVCDTGTIHLTGAPGRRPPLANARWQGQTATGEPVALTVAAGGRALQEPAHPPANGSPQASVAFGAFTQSCGLGSCSPSSPDICAYATTVTMFVGPDGSFTNTDWQEGDQAVFTGRFTGAKAVSGTFTNGAEGCGSITWSATAG